MPVQHYQGGCQCGAVRYEVDTDLEKTMTCNCSRCQRLGSVLSFTPRDKFKLLSGEENLTEYLFNKHKIQHLFCKTCGIQSFSYAAAPDGTPMAAINANCLDGVEPRQLNSHPFNGRDA
ncbi:MAG: GFA family protein [Aestuariivirga sp.]|nr:GFA family protein [Aestuariivirga sp.]